jgi:hypothetical protein
VIKPSEDPDGEIRALTVLLQLARIVGAMAQDGVLHDRAFEVMADAEKLLFEREAVQKLTWR